MAWWEKAKDDLETAEILYKNKKYNNAVFHCQQAVEKAFKAVLLKRTGEMRRIHDLVELCRNIDAPENLLDSVKEMTLAYIYSRYPDVKQENNTKVKEKSDKFLKISKEALKWAEENLYKKS